MENDFKKNASMSHRLIIVPIKINVIKSSSSGSLCPRLSNPRPMGHMWPRMGMNAAQHKIVNLLKPLKRFVFFVITCCNAFNVWPKTMLLPVWPRDAKRLHTPGTLGNLEK